MDKATIIYLLLAGLAGLNVKIVYDWLKSKKNNPNGVLKDIHTELTKLNGCFNKFLIRQERHYTITEKNE